MNLRERERERVTETSKSIHIIQNKHGARSNGQFVILSSAATKKELLRNEIRASIIRSILSHSPEIFFHFQFIIRQTLPSEWRVENGIHSTQHTQSHQYQINTNNKQKNKQKRNRNSPTSNQKILHKNRIKLQASSSIISSIELNQSEGSPRPATPSYTTATKMKYIIFLFSINPKNEHKLFSSKKEEENKK